MGLVLSVMVHFHTLVRELARETAQLMALLRADLRFDFDCGDLE